MQGDINIFFKYLYNFLQAHFSFQQKIDGTISSGRIFKEKPT